MQPYKTAHQKNISQTLNLLSKVSKRTLLLVKFSFHIHRIGKFFADVTFLIIDVLFQKRTRVF